MNINKEMLDQQANTLRTRVLEITERYHLTAPENVKAIGSRATAEKTLRPDFNYLIAELAIAWGLIAQLYDAGGKMHAKIQEQAKQLAEAKAPKVELATTQQLRMMERERAHDVSTQATKR